MKKIVLTLTAALIFGWQGLSFASSSVDALIQKLEDKGILTNQEATVLKGQIASDEKTSQEASFKSQAPDWLNSIKFTGDLRLRDQWQERNITGGTATQKLDQNRGRFRARLNFEDQINDKVKVVVGIATDGGSGRSNNVTFGGNNSDTGVTKGNTTFGSFTNPGVVLHKAYAMYTPNQYVTLIGGEMDNPIWEPVSPGLLWDPNITPVGGAIKLEKRLNDYMTPFSTNAFFVLKDQAPSLSATSTKTDPYMFVSQEGIKGNLTDKVYYKVAASYYGVSNPNHWVLDNNQGINSYSTASGLTGTYCYNFYLLGGAVDLGINDPFGELLPSPIYIPQVGVFGQYFQNLDPAQQNVAWMGGVYMGSSAINGWGTWKLTSYYKVLQRDSWLDALPDADFYSGDTNVEGWRNSLDLGLAKNVWFTLSWFHTQVYKDISTIAAMTGRSPENLFQMDLNFKF
jgi:hypothetical protein